MGNGERAEQKRERFRSQQAAGKQFCWLVAKELNSANVRSARDISSCVIGKVN